MADTKICRYCGNVIPFNSENCRYCGKYLFKEHDHPDLYCKKCKSEVNTDDNFCQKCGAVFNIPEETYDVPINNRNLAGIPYNIGILFTSIAISIAATLVAATGKDSSVGQLSITFGVAFILAEIFLYIYFLPSILAIENNHPNTYFIYVCNLLFGVTIIGWFIVLVLAMQSKDQT